MNGFPIVTAEVTFLPTSDGGRQTPPVLTSLYRHHIVIQSPDVREAAIDEDGVCRESYLGIHFVEGPEEYQLGHSAQVKVGLPYHSRVDYSDVRAGATFTIREGGRVVGFGRVIAHESRA